MHEQTQPLTPDSPANTVNICIIITRYMLVTVIITPDETAYKRGSTFLVPLYLQFHDTNHISLTVAGINDMLRVPKVALVDANISLFSIDAAICFYV